jgi:cation:H+ antiporter
LEHFFSKMIWFCLAFVQLHPIYGNTDKYASIRVCIDDAEMEDDGNRFEKADAKALLMYIFSAAGLALLLFGGDILVRGAVSLAEEFNIPPLVIGLTVVAFGTSSPELMVSIKAALSGVPELAVGNVVGSNIANILLVLGLPAMIYPIVCETRSVRRDATIMLLVSIGFMVICWFGEISFWHGFIMVGLLLAYLTWSYLSAMKQGSNLAETKPEDADGASERSNSLVLSIAFIVGGIIGLVIGSHLLIDGATAIAKSFGISDAIIGLTLVALGTSLPELATSLVAAIRRHGEVAMGNVVGSCLFNILAIMGVTAMVKPLPVPEQFLHYDLWVMLAATIILTVFAFRCRPIGRATGLVLTLFYAIYILSLFFGFSGTTMHA